MLLKPLHKMDIFCAISDHILYLCIPIIVREIMEGEGGKPKVSTVSTTRRAIIRREENISINYSRETLTETRTVGDDED
ncbi:hypothetical protein P8452_67515 [Trifolium repens]|nr:hypothetical protein P8452_67515 [Trifolium repens]